MSHDETRAADPRGVDPPRWARRAVIILIAAVLAFGAYHLAAAFLPRWWAERIGALVGGSTPTGVVWGLVVGAVFTALAVGVLAFVLRPGWRGRAVLVLVAVVLAVPNLLTLSVVIGGGSAAVEGRRIWSTEAPGFAAGTWIGVALGAVTAVALAAARWSSRRRRSQLRRLRDDLRASDEADRLHRDEAERLRRIAAERDEAERRRDEPPESAEGR